MAAALARRRLWRIVGPPGGRIAPLARELLRVARSPGLRRGARPAGVADPRRARVRTSRPGFADVVAARARRRRRRLASGARAAYAFAAFVLASPIGLLLALLPRPVYAFYVARPDARLGSEPTRRPGARRRDDGVRAGGRALRRSSCSGSGGSSPRRPDYLRQAVTRCEIGVARVLVPEHDGVAAWPQHVVDADVLCVEAVICLVDVVGVRSRLPEDDGDVVVGADGPSAHRPSRSWRRSRAGRRSVTPARAPGRPGSCPRVESSCSFRRRRRRAGATRPAARRGVFTARQSTDGGATGYRAAAVSRPPTEDSSSTRA